MIKVYRNIRKSIYNLLENEESRSKRKLLLDFFIVLCVLFSIIIMFIEIKLESLPNFLLITNKVLNTIFIVEYVLRFWVSTYFIQDIKEKGIVFAIKYKLKWIFSLKSLIDLLAIIPSLDYFRVFRTIRFLKILRFLRIFKSIRIFRDIDKFLTILNGMKQELRTFFIFFAITSVSILVLSFALYLTENEYEDSVFHTFSSSLWYSVKLLGFASDEPISFFGKIFVACLSFLNIAVFGFIISYTTAKLQAFMSGFNLNNMTRINLSDHIIICGFTKSSQTVLNTLLQNDANKNNIVLVTPKDIDDNLDGVLILKGDYTDVNILNKINAKEASYAIVFSERRENDNLRDTDLRTVLTVFNLENLNPDIHTIAEINDERNAEIIKDKINGDEILFKESIDANIIASCLKHKHISGLYDSLFNPNDNNIHELSILDCLKKSTCRVKEIKEYFLNNDLHLFGIIRGEQSYLAPKNDFEVFAQDRILYFKPKL